MSFSHAINKPSTVGADRSESGAYMYLRLRASLAGEISRLWKKRGSSDSVTAGMDGQDRLGNPSDIVTVSGAGAHSWDVLEDDLGLQILHDWSAHASDRRYCKVFMSPAAGFTGGSTTARPTATDEVAIDARDDFLWCFADDISNLRYLVNVAQSDDALQTYAFAFNNNKPAFFWATFRPDQVVSGWTLPQTGCIGKVTGHCDRMRARGPAGQATVLLTVLGGGGQPVFRYVCKSGVNGKRNVEPLGLYSSTVGMRERYGKCRSLFACGAYNAGSQPDGMDEGKTVALPDGSEGLVVTEDNAAQLTYGAMVMPWPKGFTAVTI